MSVIQVSGAGDEDAMCDACMQVSEGYEFEREVLEIQAIIAAIEDIDQAMLVRLKDLGSPRTGEPHLQPPTPPADITYQSTSLLFSTHARPTEAVSESSIKHSSRLLNLSAGLMSGPGPRFCSCKRVQP